MIPEDELLYHPHCRCLSILHRTEKERMSAPSIFYTEDNLLLAQTVRDVLGLAGWRVEHCPSGTLAYAAVESKKHFDLLILDNEIHFMTGIQLARIARRMAHRRETPIIITSIEDRAEEAGEAGADVFIRKPCNIVELVDTVRRILSSR